MKKNMGSADRTIRLIVAIIVIGLYLTDKITGTTAYILLALSAIFVLTSLISVCPLYLPFGISTRGKNEKE